MLYALGSPHLVTGVNAYTGRVQQLEVEKEKAIEGYRDSLLIRVREMRCVEGESVEGRCLFSFRFCTDGAIRISPSRVLPTSRCRSTAILVVVLITYLQ